MRKVWGIGGIVREGSWSYESLDASWLTDPGGRKCYSQQQSYAMLNLYLPVIRSTNFCDTSVHSGYSI